MDTLCPCGTKQLSILPHEVADANTCKRKPQEHMYRRRLSKCINYHPEVIQNQMHQKKFKQICFVGNWDQGVQRMRPSFSLITPNPTASVFKTNVTYRLLNKQGLEPSGCKMTVVAKFSHLGWFGICDLQMLSSISKL